FRMGIPVTPKNIFPSNIQGLPTWYEVRVNGNGYLGRRDGVDIMVCVNPQSMKADVECVAPGGYFMYDSSKMLHAEYIRDDINYLGIPLMNMCNDAFSDPRQRQLFKNIIYVGALCALLDIEVNVFEDLFKEQFKGKEKLVAPNMQALGMGIDFVKKNFKPLDMKVQRLDKLKDAIMLDGNSACGLGAVYAGATVMAWYPITPSTSVAEAFADYSSQYRVDKDGKHNYTVVQAEDELAAIGMVIGAAWNGARSFTSTSGPGVSLMNEFLGLAYFAEIPVVLIDVQRTGPSTPKECFDMTADAFDLAEELQTPVMVMTDLDLGMNDHVSPPFEWNDKRKYKRGKVLTAAQLEEMQKFGRYLDVDKDGITYRTIPGTHPTKGAFVTRGTSRDEYAVYTEDSGAYHRNMERLLKKWDTAKTIVPEPEVKLSKNKSKNGIIFFGTSTYSAFEAMDILAERNVELDALRLKAFPFNKTVEDFINAHDKVFVIEQNRDAQLRSMMMIEMDTDPKKLIPVLNYDGMPITADYIVKQITSKLSPAPKLKKVV